MGDIVIDNAFGKVCLCIGVVATSIICVNVISSVVTVISGKGKK